MRTRKNAILIFSKPPIPGLVKTRLTPIKDGMFPPETAATLYHCMLFDVVEICCDALCDLERADAQRLAAGGEGGSNEEVRDEYAIIISTTPPENVEVMERFFTESGTWPRTIEFIFDTGASFDEHYNGAFAQVWDRGFDTILSFGGDMPTLPKGVIIDGFRKLQAFEARGEDGCVVSADQCMGVSLVGWTRATNMDHDGVYYNETGLTVLPAYVAKARERGVPMQLLEAVVDVDTMLDLMHNVTLVEFIEYCAQFQDLSVPHRTIKALQEMGWSEVRVPPNELRDSREGIDV